MVTLGVQKYIRSFWNMVEVSLSRRTHLPACLCLFVCLFTHPPHPLTPTQLANLGFMGVTCFLRVKDSLKMQQLISDPSLVTSPKLQNLAFWVAQEDNCLSMAALIMWLKLLKVPPVCMNAHARAHTLTSGRPHA